MPGKAWSCPGHSPVDVGGQGHQKSGHLCLFLVRPEWQTANIVFRKAQTLGPREKKEKSKPTKSEALKNPNTGENRDRQNPDRQISGRIRIADSQRTGFFGKSGQKRDKGRTGTVLPADIFFPVDRESLWLKIS